MTETDNLAVSLDSELNDVYMEDVFINLSKASSKSSLVWNYFGFLFFSKPPKKVVNCEENRVFCNVCFEKAAEGERKLFTK